MKKPTIRKLSISIEDISDGKDKAFAAVLHDYNNAIVMGKDYKELFAGIKATIDYIKSKKTNKKVAKFIQHKKALV